MTQAQESTGRLLAGRYRLNDVLGRGGMGTVWRAEDEMLGRIVAVKELRMTGAVDEDEKHRLIVRTLREAKATARIRHTAAVTVFDVVEEDERPWIVMELVESRSLAEVIKDDGPVPPVRAAEIALDVLGVLDEAHSLGILHRDVKPSNVLIGEDGRVVLTDFGIASVEGDASITSTGMLVGAPSYISPERARGQKPGPPADLWSLGGTLYSMVEGRPPYDRGSALATLTAVMTEDLAPPLNAGPLRPVIEGLLEKDPAKRLDAATTRARLKRIVADGAARAEATTQVVAASGATKVLPAVDEDAPAAKAAEAKAAQKAAPKGAAKAAAATGSGAAAKASGPAAAAAAAPSAPSATAAPSAPAKPAVPEQPKPAAKAPKRGGVGTVRVGSRSVVPPATPAPGPAAAAAAPTAAAAAPATARPAAVPPPARPGAATPADGRPADWWRKPPVLAGAALVVVLLLVAVVLVMQERGTGGSSAHGGQTPAPTSSDTAASGTGASPGPGTGDSATPGAQTPAGETPAGQTPGGQTPAGQGQNPTGQTPGGQTPAGQATSGGTNPGGTGTVPAGYVLHKDDSGFSIVLPDWLKFEGEDYDRTSRKFVGHGMKLMVDWTMPANGDALSDWQKQETELKGGFSGYQRIRIEGLTYRQWTNAADWEWTFGSNPRKHSLNRGFVTGNGKYGYALYWTIPDADWNANAQVRQTAFDSFVPAP
ncbi:serine/threonine-protein kinase [Kitasatospora camelliae]|uniref:non-specific serine/threonine protein kinase n=1 Tax=Kitasatospora camelliae TaxID=3156397 RepID=A0AAU8JVQ5_9ACTN